MEQINFRSNEQYTHTQSNVINKDLGESKMQGIDMKFNNLLSNINDASLDEKSLSTIKKLIRKYNISISVQPNQNNMNAANKQPLIFGNVDVSGNNNLVIIPQNLLKKMVDDPKMMEAVEHAIRSDIKAYKDGECFRQITGDKSIASPLTFNEDGTWEKWGMSVTDSDKVKSDSKKIGKVQINSGESNSFEKKSNDKYLNKISSTIGKVEELEIQNLNSETKSFNSVLNNYLDGINYFRGFQFRRIDKTKDSYRNSKSR